MIDKKTEEWFKNAKPELLQKPAYVEDCYKFISTQNKLNEIREKSFGLIIYDVHPWSGQKQLGCSNEEE